MDEAGFDEWEDAVPWWADAPTDAERDSAVVCTDPDFQLSAAELLAEAELAGPGSAAQRLLASLAGRHLSPDQWLTAAQLWEAQEAWLVGQKTLAVAGFAGPEPVSVAGFRDDEALSLELGLAVGCSDALAYEQISHARLLSSTLCRTGDLLRAGRLSPYRARLIATELGQLHPEVARQVEAKVLDTAAHVPTGLLRKALLKHTKRLDPQGVNDKRVTELAEKTPGRRVLFDPDAGDGLMGMYAYLPPVEALAMQAALKAAAGAFRTADGRHQDEREADALTGMVLGFDPDHPTRPVKPKVKVGLLIDLPTLLGLRNNDGELLGYGHLPAEVARELAQHASWQRLVYDPVTGYLLDGGTQVHDLPALSEFIPMRDRRDRFPGGTRTRPLDLDHTEPFRPKPARGAVEAAPGTAGASLREPDAAADEEPRHVAPTTGSCVEPGETLAAQCSGASTVTTAVPAPTDDAFHGTPAADSTPADEAVGADRGHTDEEGGHTSADNLAALSRRHHRAKTFLGFSYRHLGLGVLEWTTPLGRIYRTYPHDYRPEGGRATGAGESDGDPPEPT